MPDRMTARLRPRILVWRCYTSDPASSLTAPVSTFRASWLSISVPLPVLGAIGRARLNAADPGL